ncbi:transcriptional regulator, MarR family [Pelagirhabdus alkalitolerans]|uniref:Transcriptional regulator, MarR family n=1 Tax=Pelagirhabdus alkalitolerans TaxID=1612202 RepID=A0A1G6GJQ9_9BACI|nr:ROK family protein [Pelagirhabdus alkalitolerans]SDB82180.1 transcriptional regulator, MarR family [Pelagirhabdus alkalitolerans]
MERGSFQGMKSLNKSIILTKILNDGPISRAQIAKETKLTPPTVGSLVKELIDQKIVKESTQGTSKGGRKPTMLVIDHKAYYMIGIDAGPRKIEVILTDLLGHIVDVKQVNLLLPITEEAFLQTLIQSIETMLSDYSHLSEDIIGIGVAMHGVVDSDSGTALYAPNLDLHNMPVEETLSNHFSYLVKVENDARALALAETWFGKAKDTDRLVVVNIGTGVGAGVVIEGELYRGESHIAGEMGHMTIDLNGEVCSCGNRGCLQTLISGPSIARRARREINRGQSSVLADEKEITAQVVYEAAENQDLLAIDLLKWTGFYLGVGLTNIIHTINPGQIILNGGVSKSAEYLLPTVRETVGERALTDSAKETPIHVSDLGDESTSLGAVALVLDELFATNGELNRS